MPKKLNVFEARIRDVVEKVCFKRKDRYIYNL